VLEHWFVNGLIRFILGPDKLLLLPATEDPPLLILLFICLCNHTDLDWSTEAPLHVACSPDMSFSANTQGSTALCTGWLARSCAGGCDSFCFCFCCSVLQPIQDQVDTMHKYCLTLLALTTTSVPQRAAL